MPRWIVVAALVGSGLPAFAQTDWRNVGGTSVELMLAAPATGPMDRVWFSPDGAILYARTAAGRVFQTTDFGAWTPLAESPAPPRLLTASAARLPEAGASVIAPSPTRATIYSLGPQLFRSDDDGRSWTNLTAYRSSAVVGTGQHGLAVPPPPGDRDQLVLANDFGVWRSLDGGLSWAGLNQFLPNLPVRRILSTPTGTSGTRIVVDRLGVLELPPGGSVWFPAANNNDDEAALMQRASAALAGELAGAEITAAAASGQVIYAGASDGRIWVSIDGPAFNRTHLANGNRVERIFVDPSRPMVALAALNGKNPGHVLRTTNYGYGYFWDSLDGNLPDSAVHGITADRPAGAVYVATDKGVFWAHADLDNNSTDPVTWTGLPNRLPAAPAMDVRLDPTGVQLYAALDGYGVYAAAAPHRARSLRILNAADLSARAAAPGGMLSVVGGQVSAARGGDLDYPVITVPGNDSQIQVPFEAVGPNVVLALQTSTGRVTRDVSVLPVSPAILVGREGAPMLWDAESGLPLDPRSPVHSGGRMQIWATGLGRVQPGWQTGVPAPLENPPAVAASVRAYLDGSPIAVARATLLPGYIGFYLIEVQLPAIANAGSSELYVSADGQESNRVRVVIEP